MILPTHLRAVPRARWLGLALLCCAALATFATFATFASAQTETAPDAKAGANPQTPPPAQIESSQAGQPDASRVVTAVPQSASPEPNKRQLRQAEDAYLAGAKKLEHDDLAAAERDFAQALQLDPGNRSYAVAISVARQHRLTELVQQATRARQSGDATRAQTLLSEARAMDPENPVVLEHTGPLMLAGASPQKGAPSPAAGSPANASGSPLADRTQILAEAMANRPWQISAPSLAGAIRLVPEAGVQSFHLHGSSSDVLHAVTQAYGIRSIVDPSVEPKAVRFDMDNVTYETAMAVLMRMAHVFAVPVDPSSVLVARDDAEDRLRLERDLEETINLSGFTAEQINDVANIVRNVFDVKQPAVDPEHQSIVVRAPGYVLDPLNRTIQDLFEGSGEVMIEVKLYAIDTTHMSNVGTALPNQFTAFNVQQEANSIVSSNQALVQQAVAQGLISATASNLEIALALIGSGLVKSTLASNLIGVVGGGLLQTGISASSNLTFNVGLNTSDTRTLDDVQLLVGDREPATFREGTRYPIASSTYSTGVSTAASALSNVSINGVSVANLLSQFAGGTSATIPQITYEDLGITLKATPVIQKSGRINLLLDMKIQSLSGSSNNGNPILDNRQFASDITVADGESALLVSNVSKTETAAMIGIPGLSELPGFQLPTERTVEKDSSQLVVMITPHITRRRSDLAVGPPILMRVPTQN